VTIAAGFTYREGILLCADSEVTSTSKVLGQKIGHFSGGDIAGAISGAVDFATASFQNLHRSIERECRTKSYSGLLDCATNALTEFYERHVLKRDADDRDDLTYTLLLVLREPRQQPRLHVTADTVLREVGTFRCMGSGEDFAEYLAKIHFRQSMTYEELVPLASLALLLAKQNAAGCGGPTMFLDIPNRGPVTGPVKELSTIHLDKVAGWFQQESTKFLLSHMGPDKEHGQRLQSLSGAAEEITRMWRDARQKK
jgi:20S proteasome alpha/beta subunit